MKKLLFSIFLLGLLMCTLKAQSTPRVPRYYGERATDPPFCSVITGGLYWNTISLQYKFCSSPNAWSNLGGGGGGTGLLNLNGLTADPQIFAIGTSGTSPNWSSSVATHTLNIPTASATNLGLMSSANWSALFASKTANFVYAAPDGAPGSATFRALVAADIPSLDAAKITSGVLATARLGSGTADNTVFLRGDGTWAAPPGGGGGGSSWGSITGTLSDQTDLNTALNARALLAGATFTGAVNLNYSTPIFTLQDSQIGGRTWRFRAGSVSNSIFDLYDSTAGASRMIVTDDGRIGFGATPPNETKLYIYGTSSSGTNVDIRSGDALYPATLDVQTNTYDSDFKSTYIQSYGTTGIGSALTGINNADAGKLIFSGFANAVIGTDTDTPLIFGQNFTERFRLDASDGVTFSTWITPATLADASAPNSSLYYSSTQSKIVFKDSGGTVRSLQESGGGGGFSNLAGAGVVPQSDGTDLIDSPFSIQAGGDAIMYGDTTNQHVRLDTNAVFLRNSGTNYAELNGAFKFRGGGEEVILNNNVFTPSNNTTELGATAARWNGGYFSAVIDQALAGDALGIKISRNAAQTANLVGFYDSDGTTLLSAINKDGSYLPPTLAAASAANNSIFVNSSDADKLYWKNGSGTAVDLTASGGGGSLTVGGAITSGTANRVLYENSSNQLAESANLTFDGTTLTGANIVASTLFRKPTMSGFAACTKGDTAFINTSDREYSCGSGNVWREYFKADTSGSTGGELAGINLANNDTTLFTTVGNNGITLDKSGSTFTWSLTNMAQNTIKGRVTASTGVPEDLTPAQTLSILESGGTNIVTAAEIDTSAEIAAIVGDETGSGSLVFGTTPTIDSPVVSTKINFPSVTALPGSPAAGDVVIVTDDSATGACDSAAGSAKTICRYNGSAWEAVGDGTGGGGGQSSIQFEDEGSNLGTSGTVTNVDCVGAGITCSRVSNDLTITVSGGGSGVMAQILFRPQQNEPPASAAATPDARNSHPVLDFDGTTDEEAVFSGGLPASYGGGGLTVTITAMCTSATTGSFRFQAAIERMDSATDLDADSFAAFNSAGGTCPATSGAPVTINIDFANGAEMDSLAAGEAFRLKIRRDADGTSGTDDVTSDVELRMISVREQ